MPRLTAYESPFQVTLKGVAAGEEPGTFLGLRDGLLAVACGGGALGVRELQRPGRKPLKAADFLNGERLRAGEKLC